MSIERTVAKALLNIKAVGFSPDQPFRFKSGLLSPVYVDNRIFPSHPKEWKEVIRGFKSLVENEKLEYEVIAGIESAGIPHSATLGYVMQKPSVFVRKAVKDHGTKKMIEGGNVTGKKVLLLEDLVTTGMSSLHGVDQIRQEKGVVTDCIAIVSFSMPEATKAYQKTKVRLHTLTNFPIILEEALKKNILTPVQKASVQDWLNDPWGWEKRR
jgi:orotate phosphoribosyltransferase